MVLRVMYTVSFWKCVPSSRPISLLHTLLERSELVALAKRVREEGMAIAYREKRMMRAIAT